MGVLNFDWRDFGMPAIDDYYLATKVPAVTFQPIDLDVRGVLTGGGMIDGIPDDFYSINDAFHFG